MTTTIETAFHHLDQLADLLRAEGFACGPDVWLSVYRLLAQFKQKNKLPHDTDQLRLLLGPLFCRNPEEQARFKRFMNVGGPYTPKQRLRIIKRMSKAMPLPFLPPIV